MSAKYGLRIVRGTEEAVYVLGDLRAEVEAGLKDLDANPWLSGCRVSESHHYVGFMAAKAACSTIKLRRSFSKTAQPERDKWGFAGDEDWARVELRRNDTTVTRPWPASVEQP